VSKQAEPSNDSDSVVEIIAAAGGVAADQSERDAARPDAQRTRIRFKRSSERVRRRVDEQGLAGSLDPEDDLRLQVMLLREENARLKAARHKPADPGSLIERMRMLDSSSEESELLDETWSVLADCILLREGLDAACIEIQEAISSVRERLSRLRARIENIDPGDAQPQADRTSLSA